MQKGHEERIRAWARERREQLREAQKLQVRREPEKWSWGPSLGKKNCN